MNNADAVCLGCYEAGGALRRIDVEHIALAAYELSPSQFCWKHYPDRIDLRKVQNALKDEMRANHPRLTGSVKEGYQLTPIGLEWTQGASEIRSESGHSDLQNVIPKIEAERRRLRMSSVFRKYSSGEVSTITRQDFDAFVRINEYFPESLRTQRIVKMENIVSGDAELEKIWAALKLRYGGPEDG